MNSMMKNMMNVNATRRESTVTIGDMDEQCGKKKKKRKKHEREVSDDDDKCEKEKGKR